MHAYVHVVVDEHRRELRRRHPDLDSVSIIRWFAYFMLLISSDYLISIWVFGYRLIIQPRTGVPARRARPRSSRTSRGVVVCVVCVLLVCCCVFVCCLMLCHVYIYVCMCVYIYIHTYIRAFISIYASLSLSLSLYIYIYIFVFYTPGEEVEEEGEGELQQDRGDAAFYYYCYDHYDYCRSYH